LKLTIDNDFDFNTNKPIPRANPNHPTKKVSATMFAFSEQLWEPRARFHLEKGILKMKEKDSSWRNIMKAIADNPVAASALKRDRTPAIAEEELELAWNSE
jgi:hypothetical protein